MDAIISIVTTAIGILFDVVPIGYLLTAISFFLIGCWFYRWMLKRNPQRLEALVQAVNNAPETARAAVDKVSSVVAPKSKDKE